MHLSGVVIKDNDGKILLLHRATPKRTQWEIPGGKIESNENPEEAAAREAREELGVPIAVARHIGSRAFIEDGYTFQYTWFEGVAEAGEPGIGEPDKYDDVRYWSVDDLKATSETISPNTKNFIEELELGNVTI